MGGVYNESGGYWEFGLCGDEDDVAKMSLEAGPTTRSPKFLCGEKLFPSIDGTET